MYHEVIIEANIVSKKNAYAQTKKGRRFKPDSVKDAEKEALAQIPADLWFREIRHPLIAFYAEIPKKNMALDLDGVFTTITDILVKAKVFKDDNIRNLNGGVILMPVKEGSVKRFTVRIYEDPTEEELVSLISDLKERRNG